jgi:predicted PurR-regulated permease PerM
VIQPLVVARTVKLHPAVVAIGVVAVDQLFGFIGLLIAVPIIATASILIDELWVKAIERGEGQAPIEQIRRSSSEGITVRARR